MFSAMAGSFGSTDEAKAVGVLRFYLEDVAVVAAVHRERRNQHRGIHPDRIHGGHHLIAGHLVRSGQNACPGPLRAVLFIAMDLSIDCLPRCGAGDFRQPYGRDSCCRRLDEFAAMQHVFPPNPRTFRVMIVQDCAMTAHAQTEIRTFGVSIIDRSAHIRSLPWCPRRREAN